MTTSESAPKKKCFVISPIGQPDSPERRNADKTLKHLIRKALGAEYEINRADEDVNPGAITPAIVASILEADLIIADLTGTNPNVFYELAIAHGYHKPVIHIQRSGERPPFDVKDMRIIPYDMDPDELEKAQSQLRQAANFAVTSPDRIETPLTSAERFKAVEESTDPVAESNIRVIAAIEELSRDVKRLISGRSPNLSALFDLNTSRAQARSLARVVQRVVKAGRASPDDFDSTITPTTSGEFDNWIRRQFNLAGGSGIAPEENEVLYDADMLELLAPDDWTPPDAAFEPDVEPG